MPLRSMGGALGCARRRDDIHTTTLSPEDLEAHCCRSGLSQDEVVRLHRQFANVADGSGTAEVRQLLAELGEPAGPLKQRLPAALRSSDAQRINFQQALSALAVFCEFTPADDKVRLFFRLYDADGDGRVSRDDLRSTLKLVLPDLEHDLINHAVDQTLLNLGVAEVLNR